MDENEITYKLMYAFFQLHRQKLNSGPVQGLNPGDLRVLRSIMRRDSGQGVKVSELGSALRVSSPFITQITNGLVKQGLVDRSPDPEDRRVVRLRLTDQGQDVIAKTTQEYTARFAGLVEELGREKSEELVELLHQVHQYFGSLEEDESD